MSEDIYSQFPHFVLGFHGCDESVRDKVLLGKASLLSSDNAYDWLGSGVYFWEQDHVRAKEYGWIVR